MRLWRCRIIVEIFYEQEQKHYFVLWTMNSCHSEKICILWKLWDNMDKIFWFWHLKILQFSFHWTFTHGCYFHQLQIIFISILFQTISLSNWANLSFNINIFLSVHLYRLTHFEQILWDHENQWLMKIHGE